MGSFLRLNGLTIAGRGSPLPFFFQVRRRAAAAARRGAERVPRRRSAVVPAPVNRWQPRWYAYSHKRPRIPRGACEACVFCVCAVCAARHPQRVDGRRTAPPLFPRPSRPNPHSLSPSFSGPQTRARGGEGLPRPLQGSFLHAGLPAWRAGGADRCPQPQRPHAGREQRAADHGVLSGLRPAPQPGQGIPRLRQRGAAVRDAHAVCKVGSGRSAAAGIPRRGGDPAPRRAARALSAPATLRGRKDGAKPPPPSRRSRPRLPLFPPAWSSRPSPGTPSSPRTCRSTARSSRWGGAGAGAGRRVFGCRVEGAGFGV